MHVKTARAQARRSKRDIAPNAMALWLKAKRAAGAAIMVARNEKGIKTNQQITNQYAN